MHDAREPEPRVQKAVVEWLTRDQVAFPAHLRAGGGGLLLSQRESGIAAFFFAQFLSSTTSSSNYPIPENCVPDGI